MYKVLKGVVCKNNQVFLDELLSSHILQLYIINVYEFQYFRGVSSKLFILLSTSYFLFS